MSTSCGAIVWVWAARILALHGHYDLLIVLLDNPYRGAVGVSAYASELIYGKFR
jgi:hypothetical protein